MCTQDKSEQTHIMKEMARNNAVKYQRYKDQLDQIDLKEIEQYRKEVREAYFRIPKRWENLGDKLFSKEDIETANFSVAEYLIFVDFEPYQNLEEMSIDIANGQFLVSGLNNDSKLLPGDLNLMFRAVHDYLHYILQQPFGFAGEYKVYQAQKHMHKSRIGRQILFSEVVLQAAYCEYFGTFAPTQKIVL